MPEPDVPLYEGPEKQGDPAAPAAWLAETGETIVATLREAGPEAGGVVVGLGAQRGVRGPQDGP